MNMDMDINININMVGFVFCIWALLTVLYTWGCCCRGFISCNFALRLVYTVVFGTLWGVKAVRSDRMHFRRTAHGSAVCTHLVLESALYTLGRAFFQFVALLYQHSYTIIWARHVYNFWSLLYRHYIIWDRQGYNFETLLHRLRFTWLTCLGSGFLVVVLCMS